MDASKAEVTRIRNELTPVEVREGGGGRNGGGGWGGGTEGERENVAVGVYVGGRDLGESPVGRGIKET